MDPLVLMSIGTALQTFSGIQQNAQRAKYEAQNAQFYEEQATLAQMALDRELKLTESKYTYLRGAQTSAIAKGGASVSEGSAVHTLASTAAKSVRELLAVKEKGMLEVKLARMRAGQSGEAAQTLSDPLYNLLGAGGTILTNYAAYKGG